MKKLISLAMTVIMIVSCFACVNVFADDAIKVVIDGKNLEMDQPPVLTEGRTLVPLRAIFEALGATVAWDDATKCATGNKDGKEIKITIDEKTAYVDGKAVTLDVPAQIVSSRTLVPVRFISESLGADVAWDGNTKTVTIESKKAEVSASGVLYEENFDGKTSFAENTDFVIGGVYKANLVSLTNEYDHTTGNGKSLKMSDRDETTDRVKFKDAFKGAQNGVTYVASAWVYTEEDGERIAIGVFGDKGTATAYTPPVRKDFSVKAKTWTLIEVEYTYDNAEITQVGIDQANDKAKVAPVIYVDDVTVKVKEGGASTTPSTPSNPTIEPTPVVTGNGLLDMTFDSLTSFSEKTHFITGAGYQAKNISLSSDVDHTTGTGKSVKLSNREKTDHRIKFVNAFDGAKIGDKFEISAWVYSEKDEPGKVRIGVFGDVGTETAYTSPVYGYAELKAKTWTNIKVEYTYDNEEITQVGFDQNAKAAGTVVTYYIDDVKVTKK